MQLSAAVPGPVLEVLHGVTVADPYRWLEDRHSPHTSAWIAEQRQLHDTYFAETPGLEYLHELVGSYVNVDVVDQPVRSANHLIYRRRRRNQEQACICIKDSHSGDERILVDPSSLGLFTNIAIHRLSHDGALLAYELRDGGSDTKEIHIVETATGNLLSDHLEAGYIRGFVFVPDNSGFYYCREGGSAQDEHEIRYHRFGEVSEDRVVFHAHRTDHSRLIILGDEVRLGAFYIHERGVDLVGDAYLADYEVQLRWNPLFSNRAIPCFPFLRHGRIFLYTEDTSPNGSIIELDKDGSLRRVVVPGRRESIVNTAFVLERVYISYWVDRATAVYIWPLDGTIGECGQRVVEFSGVGSIQLLPNLGGEASSLFYSYEHFAEPLQVLEYPRPLAVASSLPEIASTNRGNRYRVENVEVRTKDGVNVPMSLVMRKGRTAASGPVILTSYGGFGVSMTPRFSVLVNIMLELGALFAMPSIRGGMELGKSWHEAARGRNRQVAIDDFLRAAEYLVSEGWTSPDRIAAFGGSNSGLLVAAAITQRPDLFRAAICIAPLLDMLRYEVFDQAAKWRTEYGSALDPDDFTALHAYSPYHHVLEHVNYPAVLFVCGDRDDRCNPAHVRKMAARLQYRGAQTSSILVDYSEERGHSPVLPLSYRITALTRRLGFLCRELNISNHCGGGL